MRPFLLAVLPLLAAGCAAVPDPFLDTGAIHPNAPPIASEVAPELAAAYLSGNAGRIESVRQTVRNDFFEQTIVYSNATLSAGENVLTVRVGKPSEGAGFLRTPTRAAVLAEMRQVLPGVAMAINAAADQNPHGTYGYATGRLGTAGSCLYAWQFAKRITPAGDTAMQRLSDGNYAAQIRLRFCHPTMSEDRIASLMAGLRLKPVTAQTFAMLQYAGSSGVARTQPAIARAEPVAAEDESIMEQSRRKPRQHVVAEREVEEPVIVSKAVRVPLPGETSVEKASVETAGKPSGHVRHDVKTGSKTVLVPLPETALLTSATD